MRQRITLRHLSKDIEASTGIRAEQTELLLKSLFDRIADRLAEGESVIFSRIGTFSPLTLSDNHGNSGVEFTPDTNLATTVNEPFDMFEAVKLNDQVTDDMLSSLDPAPDSRTDLSLEPEEASASTAEEKALTDSAGEIPLTAESAYNDSDTVNEDSAGQPEREESGSIDTYAADTVSPAESAESVDSEKTDPSSSVVNGPVLNIVAADTGSQQSAQSENEESAQQPAAIEMPSENESSGNDGSAIVQTPPDNIDRSYDEPHGSGYSGLTLGLIIGFAVGLLFGAIAVYLYMSNQMQQIVGEAL